MQETNLTVLTVHNLSLVTRTVHSLSFSAMSLIRWAAITIAFLEVKSLARGLSWTVWLGGVSRTSEDGSMGHKCWIVYSKYDFPALSLAPRTTPSRPLISFTTIPIFHFTRLRSSLWKRQLLGLVFQIVLLPKDPYVFYGPSWPQNVLAPMYLSRFLTQVHILNCIDIFLRQKVGLTTSRWLRLAQEAEHHLHHRIMDDYWPPPLHRGPLLRAHQTWERPARQAL